MNTVLGCPKAFRAVDEVVDQAAMPGLPGLQCNVEAQAPVGVYRRLAVAVAGADDYFPAKILIAIGHSKYFPLGRPRGDDVATPHDIVALHLENVGEVGAHRDLQVETKWLLAVVGDLDVFVQSAIDLTADHQAQGACRDRPVFGFESAVGEEDASRLGSNSATI